MILPGIASGGNTFARRLRQAMNTPLSCSSWNVALLKAGIRYRSRICARHRADRSDALRAELWGVDDNLNIANMDWGSSQEAQTARVTSGGCLTVLAASMYWEQAAAESIARSNHEILQLPPRVSRFFADSR